LSTQPEIELLNEYNIYFIAHKAIGEASEDKLQRESNVSLSFDYLRSTDQQDYCVLYIDIEIYAPGFASSLYRCEFGVWGPFSTITNNNILFIIIDKSFEQAEVCFNQLCNDNGIEDIPTFILQDADYEKIIEGIIQEVPIREKTWEGNRELHLTEGGFFTMGKKTALFIQGTFVVMDQLFMLNSNVNRLHNRHMFFEQTGLDLSRYNTLRIYCNSISKSDIRLSFYQIIYLFLLVDCAAQILLSPMLNTLEPELNRYGLNAENAREYLKVASDIRGQLNHELTDAETIIDLLNKSYDWPALMQ
jgi:hypothetical protein